MKTGWWYLTWNSTGVEKPEDEIRELTDIDKEHIASCIIDGFTNGQIIQEDDRE